MKGFKNKKVVIIGGGFGGVRVALNLAKLAKNLDLILINKTPYHEFHPDLYEVATASLHEVGKRVPRLSYENLKGCVAISLEEIFRNKDINLIIGTVVSIDFKSQKVILKNMSKIAYDYLVLAMGSTSNYFGIPNLEKFAIPLKNVSDALNVRNSVDEIFATKRENEKISLIIGGGGFTGCELAGEMASFLRNLGKIHGYKHEVKLSVVEAGPVLVSSASKLVQKSTRERLSRLGVDIYLNSRITNVDKSNVYTENGLVLPFDLLVWTGGIRSNVLVDKMKGVHTKNTCLIVDKFLNVVPFKNVFAVGDVVYCFDENNNSPVAATAQTAIDQAKLTARNIANQIKGKPLNLYKPRKPKFIVPLGGKFAVGEISAFFLEGIEAWWLRKIASLLYFMSILSLPKAFNLWLAGNKFFVTNDI